MRGMELGKIALVFGILEFFLFPLPVLGAGSEIESLLKESEEALLAPPALQKSVKTSLDQHPIESKPFHRKIDLPVPKTAEAVAPIDPSAIQRIISLDLEASAREREPVYPMPLFLLSSGSHQLGPYYQLAKDDDVFSNDSGGSLWGIYLGFNPTWFISTLWAPSARLFLSGLLQTGYSQGKVLMTRSGVQPSSTVHAISLFPVDAGLQAELKFEKWLNVYIGYGPGMEIFHQSGVGVNDTVTQIYSGESVWLGFKGSLSKTIDFFIQYRRKGSGLFLRNGTFGGQIFSAGLAFNLLG